MRYLVAAAAAALLCAAAALAAPATFSFAPLFAWTRAAPLNAPSSDSAPLAEFHAIVADALRGSGGAARPLLALVYDQMTPSQAHQYFAVHQASGSRAASALGVALSGTAGGAVRMPYAQVPVGDSLSRRLLQLRPEALEVESCEELLEALEATPDASVVALVRNAPEHWLQHDACLGRVARAASAEHVVVWGAERGAAPTDSLVSAPSSHASLIELQDTTTNATGVQYMTAPIMYGVITGFFLLFTALCGLSWLMSIQTPLRFPGRKIIIPKEY